MFSVSVGVLSKIIDFDIFVRYDTVNLSDYRHFQVLSTDTQERQKAQGRVSGHKGVLVGTTVYTEA